MKLKVFTLFSVAAISAANGSSQPLQQTSLFKRVSAVATVAVAAVGIGFIVKWGLQKKKDDAGYDGADPRISARPGTKGNLVYFKSFFGETVAACIQLDENHPLTFKEIADYLCGELGLSKEGQMRFVQLDLGLSGDDVSEKIFDKSLLSAINKSGNISFVYIHPQKEGAPIDDSLDPRISAEHDDKGEIE